MYANCHDAYECGQRDTEKRIVEWIDKRIDGGRGIKECYNEALTLTMVKNAIERGDHREDG